MAMNIELLTKVANKLRRLRHREHFDMGIVARSTDCGTAACIAGFVLLDAGYKPHEDGFACKDSRGRYVGLKKAQRLLRLNDSQANRLFIGGNWPVQFGGENSDAGSGYGASSLYNDPKVAAKRILHFIETKGRE